MGRILGLDVGERRIGVAISAPEGRLAVPLRVLESQGTAADVRAIAELAAAEEAETLVVGYPRSMDGSAGPQVRRIEAFAGLLEEASGLPVEFWDERLSSVEAERAQSRAPRRAVTRGRRRRAPADDLAAAIILQSYLDRHRPPSPTTSSTIE